MRRPLIVMNQLARRNRMALTRLPCHLAWLNTAVRPPADKCHPRYTRPAASDRSCVVAAPAPVEPKSRLGLALLTWWMACCVLAQAQSPPPENEAKASLLLNFVRFTDWPQDAFTSAQAPFVIGVVGKDPFGQALDKTFSGKSVKGRSFLVKRLAADQNLKACHLLFVSASEKRRQRDLLDKLRGAPVLTVGETLDFRDHSGIVQFVPKENSVGFNINLNAAKAGKLHISSNVLRQADGVWGKYE